MKKKIIITLVTIIGIMIGLTRLDGFAFADAGISVSPMHQMMMLIPGETYEGAFTVANTSNHDETLYFATGLDVFYIGDDGHVVFEENDNYNQIVDWITIEETTGSVAPNSETKVHYSIDVPENAPSGGQYAVIRVASVAQEDLKNNSNLGVKLDIHYGIGYLIYGNVAGTTIKTGEIQELDMPSFLLDGNIVASSLIKNTGNVHGKAEYKIQIFPLFSNEEVFTTEENPETSIILPDRTMYHETIWENTPLFGIFKAIYTVNYEGVEGKVEKLIIKCPIWLLFIIIFAIIALIMYFFVRYKNRKNNKKRAQSTKAE